LKSVRSKLVEAASGVTGMRFRALAASSMIASSAIVGSALAGDDSGWLAALLSRAQGEAAGPAVAGTGGPAGLGPEVPPPPAVSAAGPSAAAPAPAQAAPAAAAPAAATTPQTTTPTTTTEPTTPTQPAVGTGPIKHVFVISLASPGYEESFGEGSLMPYLGKTLRPQGELLTEYSLLTDAGLPNLLAMVGGQPPNASTKSECAVYKNYAAEAVPNKSGVVPGDGCIYPVQALTIADQVAAGGLTWRAYVEGMEDEFGPGNCVHPGFDEADVPEPGAYAASRNPFVYFHSLLDLGACSANDVPFDTLAKDLKKADTTPNYTFIAPSRCNAGTPGQCLTPSASPRRGDTPDPAAAASSTTQTSTTTSTSTTTTTTTTADPATESGELSDADRAAAATSADAFLKRWVPKILGSAAYKRDGMLLITFHEAHPPAGEAEPRRVGALVLSPLAPKGASLGTPYDPYSVLRSTAELFGVEPLAKAAGAATESFASQLLGGGD